jgi:hypothetical protein
MRNRGGKIFGGWIVRTNSRWHMMLWGISKQQVSFQESITWSCEGVTINTNASVHCCGKKILKSDIIKGHNLGPPSLTGSLKQAWFLSSLPYVVDYLQLPSLLFSAEDKGSRFLWNVSICLWQYMASDPITPYSSYSLLWKSKILEVTSLILENILSEGSKGYNCKLFCCLEKWTYTHKSAWRH